VGGLLGQRDECTEDADRSEHVRLVDRPHVVSRRFAGADASAADACVVDEHVQFSDRLGRGGHGCVVRHVELDESAADRVDRLQAACLVARAEPDRMASDDELTGDFKAKPLNETRSTERSSSGCQTLGRPRR
jgi:hypothetical protein